MLKLPYLIQSKADKIKNKEEHKLLQYPQKMRFFRLKQLGKHVSQYNCQKQTDQIQTALHQKTSYSLQKCDLQKITFRRDKSQQILEKAVRINNKHYPQSHSSSKKLLKPSASLDRSQFNTSQDKQNCLKSIEKTLKFSHPSRSSNNSLAQIETKLHKLKNTRSFRSQWFNEEK